MLVSIFLFASEGRVKAVLQVLYLPNCPCTDRDEQDSDLRIILEAAEVFLSLFARNSPVNKDIADVPAFEHSSQNVQSQSPKGKDDAIGPSVRNASEHGG